jgi:hypothetical protein
MAPQRFVFVGGLHRSGTTLIARHLASHSAVSGFRNTGVIEDEGQFLQSLWPLESELGGAGRFSFDPRAHMTEDSHLNSPQAAKTLLAEWSRHWDMSKPVLVEKTPSNLLRMRLLARFFDESYFVVVTRHPVAACLATLKWTEGNLFSLIAHWVHCYRTARSDSAFLPRCLWVTYEDLVRDPRQMLARIWQFAGLDAEEPATLELRDDNAKYFDLWRTQFLGDTERRIEQVPPEHERSLVTRLRERLERDARERGLPPYRRRANLRNFYDAQDAVARFEPEVREFGYSLADPQ